MSETIRNDTNPNTNPGTANNVTNITVLAAPRVLSFISQETLRYDSQGLETGGILVGSWLDNDTVYLVGATGSGPMAEHAQYSFAVDTDYANAELTRLRQSFPGSDYVGEWHKHPATLERPSSGDLMTARQLLADPDYPVRLINPITTVKNHQAFCHFFYLDRDLPDFVRLQEHGRLEAENDNEPWEDGSTIYHANIVMVPKAGTVPPAQPAKSPQPAAANSLLAAPNPFTGEATDIDSQTLKNFANTYFDPPPPVRPAPNQYFEPVPPARLAPNYSGNPVPPPRPAPNQYFDPMPPARLASIYQGNQNEPFFDPVPPARLNPNYSGYKVNPANLSDDADETIAFRSLSQPKPVRSSNTLLYIVIGLFLLFAVLLTLYFLTR